MLYSALVNSPLGQVLLQANKNGLTGLYFTDQQDCPDNIILNKSEDVISKPSSGLFHDKPLAKFKLQAKKPQQAADSNSTTSSKTADLFNNDELQADLFAKFQKDATSSDYSATNFLESQTPKTIQKVLQQTASELNEYWQQKRIRFSVPLDPQGSKFQQQVWAALLKVGLGTTMSYGALGELAGFGPKHGRAIGTAVGSNPISIIIPCHRILAANGTLNGYGGGLLRKAYLLQLEGFNLLS